MQSGKGAVLVLGASRGLGEAIAAALAAAGFAVAAVCRRMADAEAVCAKLVAAGGRALPLKADVTVAAEVEAAVAATLGWAGGVVGLVNNAAVITPIGRIADTPADEWAALIAVNVTGAYHGIRAVLPHLGHGGVIVNISSGAAGHPMEGWSAYCASKAALAMLTRSIAHEYGAAGVLAYGFRPGVVDTGMQGQIRASKMNRVSEIPRENLLKPEVPVEGVVWLFRERPAELSGQEVDIRTPEIAARVAALRG